jgi:hypothetical protein
VEREGIERSGPETDPLGHARHQEQRPDRRLIEQVVVDGKDVDAPLLGAACDRLIRSGLLVGADPEAELADYVSSSVTSVR